LLLISDDGAAGRLYESPFSFSALLKCGVFFPMTHFATIWIHPKPF
jgi:hypothetical protein